MTDAGETVLIQSRAKLAIGAGVAVAATIVSEAAAAAFQPTPWLAGLLALAGLVLMLIIAYLAANIIRPARVTIGAAGLVVVDFWQTRSWAWDLVYGVRLQETRGGPIAVLEVADAGAVRRIGLPGGLPLEAAALRDLIEATRIRQAKPAQT